MDHCGATALTLVIIVIIKPLLMPLGKFLLLLLLLLVLHSERAATEYGAQGCRCLAKGHLNVVLGGSRTYNPLTIG